MPIERILEEKDFKRIITCNSKPPFANRNMVLVVTGGYFLLKPYEQTLLRLEDVMDASGEFYSIWTIPSHASYNGEAREIRTSDHVAKLLQKYIDWWKANDLYPSGKKSYQGRDPKAHFVLNDNFQPYSLSRRKAGEAEIVPVGLNDKLNEMLSKAGYKGVTASSIRDSGIKMYWDAGAHHNDLKDFTGIKTKASLDRKIRPHEADLSEVLNRVFKTVK